MALRRRPDALGPLAALAALVVLVVAGGSRADAGRLRVDAEHELDGEIQVLRVDEADDAVILEVTVPPAFGRLAPIDENFGITDGGQLVDVTIDPLRTPADAILVLDTSGSMEGSALDAAKAAARSFIETLPDDVEVGLVTFGETVVIHREPSLDRTGPLSDIDGLGAADGETALWDALVAAAGLIDTSDGGPASLVVLSDGDDTISSATRSDAVERLGSSSAVLYAVAIESPDTDLLALEEAVDQVGGQFLTTTDLAQLDSLYVDIAGRLANWYQLWFAPTQKGTRTVVVSVAGDGAVATAQLTLTGDGGVTAGPGDGPAPVLNVDDQPVLGPVAAPGPLPVAGSTLLRIGIGSMFGAFAVVGLLVARPPSQVRLATVAGADRVVQINARLSRTADRLISRHDSKHRFDARLDAAAINLRPGEFVLVWLLGTAVAAVVVA
ncbi:MAG: vWA domain-containing protein, partial [Acidimicrobiales bacterium]